MSERRVKFTYQPQLNTVSNTVRVVYTLSDGNLISTDLFKKYRRYTNPGTTAETTDEFIAVVSIPEITSIQAGSPASVPGYFRTSTLDKTYESETIAFDAVISMAKSIQDLIAAMNAQDSLTSGVSIWIGD